jgi:hypothetical protein
MSKRYYTLSFEDIHAQGCNASEQTELLEIFNSTAKLMATTLARRAEYDLKDFYRAKERGVDGFTLAIDRHLVCGQEQWWGEFKAEGRVLRVVGTLER